MIVIAGIGALATVAGVVVQTCKNSNVTVRIPARTTEQQARAFLSAQFRDFATYLNRMPKSMRDSIEAGINRAGARGMTDPEGTPVGEQVRNGILPLERAFADRWALVETDVRKTIADLGLPDTLISTVPALRDLYPAYLELVSRKDSIQAEFNRIEKQYNH